MSDHDSTDDVYDYDEYEHPEGCEDCIESYPSRAALLVPTLLIAALTVLGWTVGGPHTFGNGWGFMLGVAALVAAFLLPGVWTGILAATASTLAVHLWGSDRFADAYGTGMLSLFTVFGALMVVGLIGTWNEAGYGIPGRRVVVKDRITREAEDGMGPLDKFMAFAADHLGAHEFARASGGAEGPRKVIGLSGYAGSGKDTAAAELIFNNDYTRVSFADKLRAFVHEQDPIVAVVPADALYDKVGEPPLHQPGAAKFVRVSLLVGMAGWEDAKYGCNDLRVLLQRTGTDAGRKVLGENVWVDAVMADLPDGPIVFTDTRFPNEAQAIRDAGGYVVRVTRPGVEAVNAHVSETALDGWDFDAALINESTPAAAREQMRNIEEVLYDPS